MYYSVIIYLLYNVYVEYSVHVNLYTFCLACATITAWYDVIVLCNIIFILFAQPIAPLGGRAFFSGTLIAGLTLLRCLKTSL